MIPRSERVRWRFHAAALALYVAVSAAFLDHGVSATRNIEGLSYDPTIYIWCLAWWPWAISHHLNPLYTHLLWQPAGVDLAWVTSVPLLSLAGLPLTLVSGPVLTYNVLIIGAPVLAGWAGYLLCLDITRAPAASLIGGYLFGFSSYEMAQTLGHLNLAFTMFVPLLLLAVLRRLRGDLDRRRFVLGAGAMAVCQFLISIEIFATMFIFGGLAWGLAWMFLPEWRAALRRLIADALAALPAVILVLSPFLVSMRTHYGAFHLPGDWPYSFSTDLLNFFIPTVVNLFGGFPYTAISTHFSGNVLEQDGYIGLPLIAMICLFAARQHDLPMRRFLLAILLCVSLASLGPRLLVGGHETRIVLPWALAVRLPLAGSALPARFALFASLIIAIIAAIWAAEAAPCGARKFRLAIGGLACVALLPRPHPWMGIPQSRFFQPGNVQAALGANAQILVLPFAINGPSSFWQEESGFSFSQTGGYIGSPPAGMLAFPAVNDLIGNVQPAGFLGELRRFCAATGTQFVVAGPGTPGSLLAALHRLGWPYRRVDDADIFTAPAGHE